MIVVIRVLEVIVIIDQSRDAVSCLAKIAKASRGCCVRVWLSVQVFTRIYLILMSFPIVPLRFPTLKAKTLCFSQLSRFFSTVGTSHHYSLISCHGWTSKLFSFSFLVLLGFLPLNRPFILCFPRRRLWSWKYRQGSPRPKHPQILLREYCSFDLQNRGT